MATVNTPQIIPFGPQYTGKATLVAYVVLDNAGNTVINQAAGAGNGVSEPIAGTGSYSLNLAIDPTWLPCVTQYSISGQAGVGIQGTISYADMPQSVLVTAIWSTLLSGFSTSGSVGLLFKSFLNALGVDSRPKISADVHTGGATIAAVAGGVALGTDDRATIQATKTSVDSLAKGSEGIYATGTIVDPSPSTRGFLIMLDEGQTLPDDQRYVTRGLWFDGDPATTLAPGKNKITGYDIRTADTAYVSFTRPWSGIPANGSTFKIA